MRSNITLPDEAPPLHMALLILLAAAGGALLAAVVLPAWQPRLSESLLGAEPKAYWYLSRSSGLVAYSLLWASMLLGIGITSKVALLWPGGPTAFDLHRHSSLLGLAFTLFHALILLGDRYTGYTVGQIATPFASEEYRPVWVGLGQVGGYMLAIVTLSFYIRRVTGPWAWRLIHGLSFAVFLLALAHGLWSGSDSEAFAVQVLYWVSGGSVLLFTTYRVLIRARINGASRWLRPTRAHSGEPRGGS